MSCSPPEPAPGSWAVWITGLPASGKSTLTAALLRALAVEGVRPAVLESDVLRRVLTPQPSYEPAERDTFYAQMVWVGRLLASHGVPVIFDATANRRAYRQAGREAFGEAFVEVLVDSPLRVCAERDPKGIYRRAVASDGGAVPGLGVAYERPSSPEMVVQGSRESPDDAARRVVDLLRSRGLLRSM